METIKSFAERVHNVTGRELVTMPIVGEENAHRHILCRWNHPDRDVSVLIVGMDDYPQQDADGNPVFTQFGKVILK